MSASPLQLELSSRLAASRSDVWAVVSTMRGVNDELMPFVRMTYPTRIAKLSVADVVPGAVLFHSWILGLGAVPFDLHALALQEIRDGAGFVEESASWLQRRWRHERELTDTPDGGCVVTDRLLIEPRLALARPLVGAVVARLFAHRHRQLRARFGTA